MNQIKLHKRIEEILKSEPVSADINEVRTILATNSDAKQYFYTKADERWLDWLWKNGFLDIIKEKSSDLTKYRYKTHELNYLVTVARKDPVKVTDIILAVQISSETLNPEVLDRFAWICSTLPPDQLVQVVEKIKNERWVELLNAFNRWGFEYEKMLKTLFDAKDYKNLLVLSEAVLSVRNKESIDPKSFSNNPFFFDDLSHVKVFKYIINLPEEYKEKALAVVTQTLSRVVLLGDEQGEGEVFKVKDSYHLFDVDFFTLQFDPTDRHMSHRDDVRDLAATVKTLVMDLVGRQCDNSGSVKKIYDTYIAVLPDSRSMWRLRLFIFSLCPHVFKAELKDSFFRIFQYPTPWELTMGAEYENALHATFSALSEPDRRMYVSQVIDYFSAKGDDEREQKMYKHSGRDILSSIFSYLTDDEQTNGKTVFGEDLDPNYKPEPSVRMGEAGSIAPQAPITLEEFYKFTIHEVVEKLKTEWSPEVLRKTYQNEDFRKPINAEGVGNLLRADMIKRFSEYTSQAVLFFDRNNIHPHYTYSFLRGLQEILSDHKEIIEGINWSPLFGLFLALRDSGVDQPFDNKVQKGGFDGWLSSWSGVHFAWADVVQELIAENNKKVIIDFFKYREEIWSSIVYLLNHPDPDIGEENENSEPFTRAINTAKGRAFQAFVVFIYQDGKKFDKDYKVKISADVKEVYESTLTNDKTQAMRFMFGHYIPSFYYRDIEWIHGLLPVIFPEDKENTNLYLAAWEGYLSTTLYKEIFADKKFQALYQRAISFPSTEYTKRKYFKDLDDGLAVHLALALMYFEDFDLDHELFKAFWSVPNTKRFTDFISFMGRRYISGDDNRSSSNLTKDKILERIMKFWDWAIENCNDPKALAGFGFWMNTEKGVLPITWLAERIRKTLEKTGGDVDWDYGITRAIIKMAKEAPKDTLEILRLYLKHLASPDEPSHGWIYLENEVFEAFKILYANPELKASTYNLIDELLPLANGHFWKLKEVFNA